MVSLISLSTLTFGTPFAFRIVEQIISPWFSGSNEGVFYEGGKGKYMGKSFFLDDSVLRHSPCGPSSPLSFGNIRVLGLLCLDPSVPFASFILYEENGLQGYAQGVS
jgi:hypothetical protein